MKVWDPLVRVLHWTLVASVAIAWTSTLHWGFASWHEPAGYVALAAAALRVLWGFTGSRHARFSEFVRAPRAVLRYAAQLRAHAEARYIGHNPLGGWMILALLACIAALGLTGWLYTTDAFWGMGWLNDTHYALAWLLLGLIALHLGGVAYTSLRHRENLVAAMITGSKPPSPTDGGPVE